MSPRDCGGARCGHYDCQRCYEEWHEEEVAADEQARREGELARAEQQALEAAGQLTLGGGDV